MLNEEVSILVKRLKDPVIKKTAVIEWGSPIPSFGNLVSSKIATVGLNPSNREFVDLSGKELEGSYRRFHTLNSLGIKKWEEIDESHLSSIVNLCFEYFSRNPYDGWFKKLDNIISGTSMSYYFPSGEACHLDLIPYATSSKWTDLTLEQKKLLLEISGDTLGLLLKRSKIEMLILNGKTVVETLQKISNVSFEKVRMDSWTLPRKGGGVAGYAYKGTIRSLGGHKFKKAIKVLGYNHNIQSSYGVTKEVQLAIRNWITNEVGI
ncbi:hypothetical protein [Chitinophaga sp. S165]|uniref:hypothetical protein n=1 Tax=Chitinophaga sp. S165 TaxID=2135462 RepID=UPI000D9D9502|nr:hypothetical protein [Chitinophaga sp. S165]PWV46444.1 hypothetical protein C7475_1104 [Chitinophaga sp. S165]